MDIQKSKKGMKQVHSILNTIIIVIVSVAVIAGTAGTVVVFLGNLSTAMAGTGLASIFTTSFLTLLFGVFVLMAVLGLMLGKKQR